MQEQCIVGHKGLTRTALLIVLMRRDKKGDKLKSGVKAKYPRPKYINDISTYQVIPLPFSSGFCIDIFGT